jgi:hypothetical protein
MAASIAKKPDYQRGDGRLPPADRRLLQVRWRQIVRIHIQILGPSDWFSRLADEMHAEQRTFLRVHGLVG